MSNNNNNNNNQTEPPASNPILTAYEDFVHNTPFITRCTLYTQVVSYVTSWLILDPYYALATIPKFILYDYEVYRLVLSPFVNTNFFSILLTFYSFYNISVRYEQSIGSLSYLYLCCTIGVATNVLFVVYCLLLYILLNNNDNASVLLYSTAGLWNVLFGIIAIECVERAPHVPKRKFFMWDVPVLYYPFVLLLFFCLLGGSSNTNGNSSSSVSYFISAMIGYGIGFGKLEFFTLKSAHVRTVEQQQDGGGSLIGCMTRQEGWITGPAALGSNAWANDTINNSASSSASSSTGRSMFSNLPLFQSTSRETQPLTTQNNEEQIRAGSIFRQGRAAVASSEASASTTTNFSTLSGGRALGGGNNSTNQRRSVDAARAARLQVLDKQTINYNNSNEHSDNNPNNNNP